MKVTVILLIFIVNILCLFVFDAHGDVTQRNRNRGKGSMWWGIAKAGEPNNISPVSPGFLDWDPSVYDTLRKKQKRLTKDNPGLLLAISKGANNAIYECQHQFRNQRWNCSTRNFLKGKNLFGRVVERGCRETAFIYAITSAAVTHAIARACSEGSIDTCNCETHYKARPQLGGPAAPGVRDFEWGGCSDNIGFGFAVSREFVDTGERGKTIREKMNLHNNEAGRYHVQAQMRQECKCHGMSGSCTVKTCWMRLPPFRVIGDLLKDRYDGASHVTAGKHRRNTNNSHKNRPRKTEVIQSNSIHAKRENRKKHKYGFRLHPYNDLFKPPGALDLVYHEGSPTFCEKNPQLGFQGTHGRFCNDTSLGADGCDIMCCGRGRHKQEVIVVERCNCTFHWCCDVKCEVCKRKKTVYTCV